MKNKCNIVLLSLFFLLIPSLTKAFKNSYNVKVGDTFTVYTSYYNNIYAVLWDYDYSVVQPVGYVGPCATQVTFKAISTSPNSGSIIQATIYYYKDNTTYFSSRAVEDWLVHVTDPSIYVSKITVNPSSLDMFEGEEQQLTATILPSNATNKNVKWWSSKPSVVSVTSDGYVKAISRGEAWVTCEALDGSGTEANCFVIVQHGFIQNNKPTSISLPDEEYIEVGESLQLEYYLTPENAETDVTWLSSNSNVASVSSTGLVTGVKEGTATITVFTSNDLSSKCKVTVMKPAEPPCIDFVSVECLNSNLSSLTSNDKLRFRATFRNTGASSFIRSAIILTKYQSNVVFAQSDSEYSLCKSNSNTTIDYEYSLDTIPQGKYQATVMYYDAWNKKSWIYKGDYLYNILIAGNENKQIGDGTLEHPFSPQEAIDKAWNLAAGQTGTDSYYVKGIISKIKYTFNARYGTATFWISEDGSEENQFYVYGTYYLNNKRWVDGDDQISVGDEVIVYGKMANYKGTVEMADKENYIYSHNGKTGSSSAVNNMLIENRRQTIYSVSGQRRSELKKGLNIVDGKIVIKK